MLMFLLMFVLGVVCAINSWLQHKLHSKNKEIESLEKLYNNVKVDLIRRSELVKELGDKVYKLEYKELEKEFKYWEKHNSYKFKCEKCEMSKLDDYLTKNIVLNSKLNKYVELNNPPVYNTNFKYDHINRPIADILKENTDYYKCKCDCCKKINTLSLNEG